MEKNRIERTGKCGKRCKTLVGNREGVEIGIRTKRERGGDIEKLC